MFPIYPGFENLPIRVEVEWRGQTRMVIVKVSQWLTSSMETAVIICSFEEEAELGEWIITDRNRLRLLSSPQKRLVRHRKLSLTRPYVSHSTEWNQRSEKNLRLLVQGTFNKGIARHGLARIFYLAELRNQLKVVVEMPHDLSLHWCPTQNLNDATPFILDESTRLSSQNTEAYAQLRNAWQDMLSDARFAWKWSGLNKSEKILEIMSFLEGSDERCHIENEMQRIMRLILINYEMWGPDEQWDLYFVLGGRSVISHEDGRIEKDDQDLHEWNTLLRKSLMPQLRYDLLERHVCVQDCWTLHAPSASVSIEQPPTAHEQLEAKLALRDWLRDVATPDVAAALLASLDA